MIATTTSTADDWGSTSPTATFHVWTNIPDDVWVEILTRDEDEFYEHEYFVAKFVKAARIFKSQVFDRSFRVPKRKMKAKGIFKKGRCHG